MRNTKLLHGPHIITMAQIDTLLDNLKIPSIHSWKYENKYRIDLPLQYDKQGESPWQG